MASTAAQIGATTAGTGADVTRTSESRTSACGAVLSEAPATSEVLVRSHTNLRWAQYGNRWVSGRTSLPGYPWLVSPPCWGLAGRGPLAASALPCDTSSVISVVAFWATRSGVIAWFCLGLNTGKPANADHPRESGSRHRSVGAAVSRSRRTCRSHAASGAWLLSVVLRNAPADVGCCPGGDWPDSSNC
jgi:hypothetical protein